MSNIYWDIIIPTNMIFIGIIDLSLFISINNKLMILINITSTKYLYPNKYLDIKVQPLKNINTLSVNEWGKFIRFFGKSCRVFEIMHIIHCNGM